MTKPSERTTLFMMNQPDTYRILDASLNRCGEGLRTMEEYARFVLNDAAKSATAKQLRHQLWHAAKKLDRIELLSSRNVRGDVGTTITTESETSRVDSAAVVGAAIARTQQSLRCLEEYGKVIDATFAANVEAIRYRFYEFAANIELAILSPGDDRGSARRKRLQLATLYALIDAGDSETSFVDNLRLLAGAGVDMFQLRDRNADDRTLYLRSVAGGRLARELSVLFIVNDRADIAASADCDGVHVGQEELPAAAARRIIGQNRLLGISTHCIAQVQHAVLDGADCIGCGPMFAGSTKPFDHYAGPEFLQQVVKSSLQIPAFAIGGIHAGNVSSIIEAGGTRIAVTHAISGASDRAAAAQELKQKLTKVAV